MVLTLFSKEIDASIQLGASIDVSQLLGDVESQVQDSEPSLAGSVGVQ